jgi:hypothetical protein
MANHKPANFLSYGAFAGFAFGGRPLPGTLRIASSVSVGYRASVDTGLIPSWKILCLAVFGEISSSSAISFTVKNSFPFINISQFIGNSVRKYKKIYSEDKNTKQTYSENTKKRYNYYTQRV